MRATIHVSQKLFRSGPGPPLFGSIQANKLQKFDQN